VVGVLVLVDEDVAEDLLVVVADLLEELQDVHGADEQVVEVHGVGAVHLALVEVVDVGDRALEERADELAVGVRVAQLVLRVGDLVVDGGGREALRVRPDLVQAALGEPARIGLVVDRELARVAEAPGLRTEQPRAGGVEGHHPHAAHAPAEQQLDALAHLPRRLVGEGDREDLVVAGHARVDEVRDAVCEHARLARAGAREHEQRPLAVDHRRALLVVEAFQERCDPVG
jgi:hypothetical protein